MVNAARPCLRFNGQPRAAGRGRQIERAALNEEALDHRLVLAVLVGLTFVVPTAGLADAEPRSLPDRIELPDGWQPEGITIGPGPIAYLGSRTDGDILAANLKTGAVRVFSQGPGPGFPAIGLKSDQRGLLYVAGGNAGTGRVVSTRTGETLRTYQFATGHPPAAPTFVNDVVLSKPFAWFTDSQRPQLYRVPRARRGRPAHSGFTTLPLAASGCRHLAPPSPTGSRSPRTAERCSSCSRTPATCSGSIPGPAVLGRSISAAPC